jgi:carbamoyl-phosphate synthase small subunit
LRQPALLALADGSLFWGESIGGEGQTVGEVVFNTALTGYQEILTDPSYARQIVTLTYPHIGNVGTNDEDEESSHVFAAGLVIRELSAIASNWRSQLPLDEYLRKHKVVAIHGIDTRRLTRILREKGAQNGCIVAGDHIDADAALAAARAFPGLKGMDLAKEVCTRMPYEWAQGSWTLAGGLPTHPEPLEEKLPYHVVAFDYGVKRNILRMLVDRGCRITVLPAQTPAEEVMKLKPDGVFLSNGPGDPEPCDYAIEAIKTIVAKSV